MCMLQFAAADAKMDVFCFFLLKLGLRTELHFFYKMFIYLIETAE